MSFLGCKPANVVKYSGGAVSAAVVVEACDSAVSYDVGRLYLLKLSIETASGAEGAVELEGLARASDSTTARDAVAVSKAIGVAWRTLYPTSMELVTSSTFNALNLLLFKLYKLFSLLDMLRLGVDSSTGLDLVAKFIPDPVFPRLRLYDSSTGLWIPCQVGDRCRAGIEPDPRDNYVLTYFFEDAYDWDFDDAKVVVLDEGETFLLEIYKGEAYDPHYWYYDGTLIVSVTQPHELPYRLYACVRVDKLTKDLVEHWRV